MQELGHTFELEEYFASYRSPFADRAFAAVRRWVFAGFLCLIAVGVHVGVFMPIWTQQTSPNAAVALTVGATIIVPLVLAALVLRGMSRSYPARLRLAKNHILLGTGLWKVRINRQQLRLLKITRPDYTAGKKLFLLTLQDGARRHNVWLRREPAMESFEMIRELCDHVPAISDGAMHAPLNESHFAEGLATLGNDLRAQSRRALLAAAVCGCIALGYFTLMAVTGNFSSIGGWYVALTFTGGTAASVTRSKQLRTSAAALLAADAASEDDY